MFSVIKNEISYRVALVIEFFLVGLGNALDFESILFVEVE